MPTRRISKDELNFHKLLNALAGLCRYELDDVLIAIYDVNLRKVHSYSKICEAIEKIIIERNSRDPFPSVKQVAEMASGGRLKQKEVAVDVANTIVSFIGSRGYVWPQTSNWGDFQIELKDALGEVGYWVVQKYGGWVKVCQDANKSDLTTFKAQLRDSALSIHSQLEKGYIMLPAQEKIGVSDKIKGLVKNSLKSLKSME